MSSEESTSGTIEEGPHQRRHRKKRRVFWKRRQFWIALFSILIAIILVLWLIPFLSKQRGAVD